MRSTLRIAALIVVLPVLLVPLGTYAAEPCPDDPTGSANCLDTAPPYFVVLNRSVEIFDRPGTGCQPIILDHPECQDCTAPECTGIDIEDEVCQYLPAAAGDELFVLCCNCAADPAGDWMYATYELDGTGGCTMVSDGFMQGLPPGTGIDLPAPIIIGALVLAAAVLVAAGLVVRRRTVQTA